MTSNGEEPGGNYNSSSDEDFDPNSTAHNAEVEQSSSDEDVPRGILPGGKKRAHAEVDALDFENSGDEAMIRKGHKKKRKAATALADDDDGGEGGLIKTRAQRKAEKAERKPLVQTSGTSLDVDSLWAQMASGQKANAHEPPSHARENATGQPSSANLSQREANRPETGDENKSRALDAAALEHDNYTGNGNSLEQATVKIKHSYNFAGQTVEQEKVVQASSAEARAYIEHQSRLSAPESANPPLRRPKKRTSMFNSGAGQQHVDGAKAPKLNTLEKSKLDWAAHVDQAGLTDELDIGRKAKGGYHDRMDFLGRMSSKEEDTRREQKR